MTIIELNKNRFYGQYFYIGILLLVLAVLSINFYNLNVNFKYNLSKQSRAIQDLEAVNADLRNQLYDLLDVKNLNDFAVKENLINDKNPEYLEHKAMVAR